MPVFDISTDSFAQFSFAWFPFFLYKKNARVQRVFITLKSAFASCPTSIIQYNCRYGRALGRAWQSRCWPVGDLQAEKVLQSSSIWSVRNTQPCSENLLSTRKTNKLSVLFTRKTRNDDDTVWRPARKDRRDMPNAASQNAWLVQRAGNGPTGCVRLY